MKRRRVIIMGAAGRDFHNFNTVYRDNPQYEVMAFTAAQIPFIEKRLYPPELAGYLYPKGIPIYPESLLEDLVKKHRTDEVVFAYSDVSHTYVMHTASRCLALGVDFILLGTESTMLVSKKPVISVCAVRTGCGKSGITGYIAGTLKMKGIKPVIIRHPMPYCDRLDGRVQRFETPSDITVCTIEEREEFEQHVRSGFTVYAGVDYIEVLKKAELEADMVLWDGGNNDLPFIKPDLEVVVLDPHRPGHELAYHPGETNLRRAGIAVINKTDTAGEKDIKTVEQNIRMLNPGAAIVRTASVISADKPERIEGRKILVVEDGPTLTHGGMPYGAGTIAAKKFGACEVVDPRPYAKGSIKETFRKFGHIGNLLPAMGYSPEQTAELRESIEDTPCDLVLIATPVDLTGLLGLTKETVRVTYRIEETTGESLRKHIEDFLSEV
ncbi:MAG: GTPase [Nitrospirae bacterium]|nr:GTPase [Nitrospirota bacterium]